MCFWSLSCKMNMCVHGIHALSSHTCVAFRTDSSAPFFHISALLKSGCILQFMMFCNCCCPFFFLNVNISVIIKHIIISGILDCMTYSLYPNINRKLMSEICRPFHFPFKSKARRFILTVIVEVKRETIWSWNPISFIISNIQMQNATFITASLRIPSDRKIRMQIYHA